MLSAAITAWCCYSMVLFVKAQRWLLYLKYERLTVFSVAFCTQNFPQNYKLPSGGHSCSQHANYTLPQNLWHLWHCAVIKLHMLEWSFIVSSLRHTCVIIMLSNQHLDMSHLWGGWLSHSLTQIYTDLWTIFERNSPFVYIEKALDLWVQLMKNGGKTKVLCLWFCSV